MRAVETLRKRAFGVVEIGDRLVVLRQRLLLAGAANLVDGDVAADHDQPGRRVARRAVARPGVQGAQAGILEGFFGNIEDLIHREEQINEEDLNAIRLRR